jgi:UDPglucose 6-dehydrogenase
MKVAVIGQTHLGAVTAACLVSKRIHVQAVEENPDLFYEVMQNADKIEPGLSALRECASGFLEMSMVFNPVDIDAVWFCEEPKPKTQGSWDVGSVIRRIIRQIQRVVRDIPLIISSQLPVGSCHRIMDATGRNVVYVPENLRHGAAIQRFMRPDRIVLGLPSSLVGSPNVDHIMKVISPEMNTQILTVGIREAEMVKHAINAFLATEISFANELGCICDELGVNKKEVAEGLQSDARIGHRSYLKPGGSFRMDTLGRDLGYLLDMVDELVEQRRLRGFLSGVLEGVLHRNNHMRDKENT